jgi:hypothetical protein
MDWDWKALRALFPSNRFASTLHLFRSLLLLPHRLFQLNSTQCKLANKLLKGKTHVVLGHIYCFITGLMVGPTGKLNIFASLQALMVGPVGLLRIAFFLIFCIYYKKVGSEDHKCIWTIFLQILTVRCML